MDLPWLVLTSLVIGLAVGAGSVALLHYAARRRAETARQTNRALPEGVEQIIDALDTAAIVLDPSNNVVKASPAALSMGLVRLQRLVHRQLVALVDRVRETGEPVAADHDLARSPIGGADLHVRVRTTRLGARDILLLAYDHTENFRLDQVRRDFVANISHELKTPISAVSLLAEALESAADEPDQMRRFARQLTDETSRLGRITNDIIELSRLQATDPLGSARRLRVRDLLITALEQNRVAAEARDISLAVRGGKKAKVFGDEVQLVSALNNLISNAIQHSPNGSQLGIGVQRADGIVEIAVTDQGEGIPEADLDRVFERFFRVDSARSRQTGGTGLGLAIVKHAVHNHGGDVRAWSQLGHGSTFTIRLPEAAPASPASPAAPATSATITTESGGDL